MTVYTTADLAGPLLDAMVATAERQPGIAVRGTRCFVNWHVRDGLGAGDAFSPSSAWSCGGPIIERAGISVVRDPQVGWRAGFDPHGADGASGPMADWLTGPSPLVASMRAYVARQLGGTVDLDESLRPADQPQRLGPQAVA